MKTRRPVERGVATAAMIGASFCFLVTAPAAFAGDSLGSQDCRYSRAVACRQANAAGAYRPYEHWQDGSPAVGSTAPQHYGPNYSHGYNAFYGFGR